MPSRYGEMERLSQYKSEKCSKTWTKANTTQGTFSRLLPWSEKKNLLIICQDLTQLFGKYNIALSEVELLESTLTQLPQVKNCVLHPTEDRSLKTRGISIFGNQNISQIESNIKHATVISVWERRHSLVAWMMAETNKVKASFGVLHPLKRNSVYLHAVFLVL